MLLRSTALSLATVGMALTIGSQTARASAIVTSEYSPSITLNLDACGNSGAGLCMPDLGNPGSFINPTLRDIVLIQNTSMTTGGSLAGPIDGEATDLTLTVGPFAIPSVFPSIPTKELGVGWINYLPSDGDTPTDHVVLFVNTGSIAAGSSWDTLFNFSESQILQDLKDTEADSLTTTYQNASNDLFFFQVGDLVRISPTLFATPNGGNLDAVAFSDSSLIGAGTTSSVDTPTGATPEPSAWMPLLLSAGCLGFLKLRRRSAARSR